MIKYKSAQTAISELETAIVHEPNQITTIRIPVEAGAFVRGQLKRNLRLLATQNDLDFNCEEDKGFLNSILYFKFVGYPTDLMGVIRYVKRLGINLGEDK